MTEYTQTVCPQCGGSLEGSRREPCLAGSRDQSRAAGAPDEQEGVRAIAFDVFGTLLRITDPRDPWRQIARAGAGFSIDPRRESGTLPQFAAAFGTDWTKRWSDDLGLPFSGEEIVARPAGTFEARLFFALPPFPCASRRLFPSLHFHAG